MQSGKGNVDAERRARLMAEVQQRRTARDSGYREQALRLFPHVCARCGRAFAGKTLRELTVHHKDHNHHNNPPDGSNWELLCLYCHDNEHQDAMQRDAANPRGLEVAEGDRLGHNAFSGLAGLLHDDSREQEKGTER